MKKWRDIAELLCWHLVLSTISSFWRSCFFSIPQEWLSRTILLDSCGKRCTLYEKFDCWGFYQYTWASSLDFSLSSVFFLVMKVTLWPFSWDYSKSFSIPLLFFIAIVSITFEVVHFSHFFCYSVANSTAFCLNPDLL